MFINIKKCSFVLTLTGDVSRCKKLLFESPESRTASPFNITSVCIDWHNDFGVSHVNCEHVDIDTMNKNDYSFESRICSSDVLPTKSQSSLLRKCEGKMEVDWSSISQSEAKTQALKEIIPEENGTFNLKVRHPVSSVVDDLLTCQQEIHSSNLGQFRTVPSSIQLAHSGASFPNGLLVNDCINKSGVFGRVIPNNRNEETKGISNQSSSISGHGHQDMYLNNLKGIVSNICSHKKVNNPILTTTQSFLNMKNNINYCATLDSDIHVL